VIFDVGVVHLQLGRGAVLAEALFFPEISRLAAGVEEARGMVARGEIVDLKTAFGLTLV